MSIKKKHRQFPAKGSLPPKNATGRLLSEKFSLPVFDMGEENERFRGIFSSGYEDSTVNRYLHEQFRENAETYVNKTELKLSRFLLANALNVIDLKAPVTEGLDILELGAGGRRFHCSFG